jgi:carotenoid cleavage dioxygenase
VYDVERSRAGMSFLDSHIWRPELGMRVLVLDKDDVTRMRWLQLPAGFVFHLGNAWSSPDGLEVHLDYIRSDDASVVTTSLRELMRGQIRPSPGARLTQVQLNLRTGRAEQFSTEHVAEFPKIDTRRTAQRHHALFMVAHTAPSSSSSSQPLNGFDTVMRVDTNSGQVQQYRFGHRTLVEEHVFVPASASAREGEGWLIGTVFDVDAGCTRLTAFDAQSVSAGPVAMASLNGVAPLGLHGLFRPA